ncbi:flavin reductase family protein [Mycolicibacterium septicum DSM 44393]|uniref:Flavin reductase family protein n=2 Tax=Mycolicibacterium septicum TaxID=98668 RepID=A0A7X6MLV7_9MYCO|nr:flavin reductase family protein [Mycolicibacterium septicum]NKZ10781.1 flavin reductase family protein [Mycolicibacterium septicum DSM 44393]
MFDTRTLRDAYGHFPTGVVAICAEIDGIPVGMAVSAFVPVSLEPPLLGVCVQLTSTTWPSLRGAHAIGVSVLGADQVSHARQLATKHTDRFQNLGVRVTPNGAVLLDDAEVWFACHLADSFVAGDHEIALLHVDSIEFSDSEKNPMVFHGSQFHQVLFQPTSPSDLDLPKLSPANRSG